MRRLIALVLVLAALWSGYWYIGQRGIETALTTWIDARENEGWVANYSKLNTSGYPNRFDTTITDLELADPETGLAWSVPWFQILTLSYTPNHIIVAFPPEQRIASPLEKINLMSEVMRGSVRFQPDTSLALDKTSFELKNVTLSSDDDWSTHIESGQFATRQSDAVPNGHEVYFDAVNLTPSSSLMKQLDRAGILPGLFRGVKLDFVAGFDAPWDRFALEDRRPQPTSLSLREFDATWGQISVQVAGDLTIDAAGWPTGKLNVRAKNWRDMLIIARDGGLVPADIYPTIEKGLSLIAGLAGNEKTLDAPVTFRNATMYVAGLPIGPAPNFRIR